MNNGGVPGAHAAVVASAELSYRSELVARPGPRVVRGGRDDDLQLGVAVGRAVAGAERQQEALHLRVGRADDRLGPEAGPGDDELIEVAEPVDQAVVLDVSREGVLTVASVGDVGSGAAIEPVVAAAAEEVIGAAVGKDHVVAGVAEELVRAAVGEAARGAVG